MKRFGLAVTALAAGIVCAQAQDTLKIAIGQINNWENQAPTLGEDAGIFKKHNLKIEASVLLMHTILLHAQTQTHQQKTCRS